MQMILGGGPGMYSCSLNHAENCSGPKCFSRRDCVPFQLVEMGFGTIVRGINSAKSSFFQAPDRSHEAGCFMKSFFTLFTRHSVPNASHVFNKISGFAPLEMIC